MGHTETAALMSVHCFEKQKGGGTEELQELQSRE